MTAPRALSSPLPPPAPAATADRQRLALLLALLVFGSLYRLLALKLAGLDLYVDEAQYWTWAKNLAWGYFSKPPVIAAVIAATTAVCGDGAVCVKSGALLLYPATTLLLWAIARRLFDGRVAFWVAVAFFTLPGVAFSSMIISTDVPLFVCWALALWAYLKALDEDSWRWWLLAGLAGGAGLLTKYTMAIFAVSVVLHLALTPAARHHLRNPKLYAGALLAALLFAPNILWNASHGWPTLQHTAQISGLESGLNGGRHGLNWRSFGDFAAGQLAILGPVLFLAWLVQLGNLAAWRSDPRYRLLACFALPFLLTISAQALLGRANANWAAMAYAGGTIWVVARLLETQRTKLLTAAIGLNVALMLLTYHYDALLQAAGIEMTAKRDVYKRVRGWSAFGEQLGARRAEHPDALLLSDARDLIAEAMFYVQPHPMDMAEWNPSGAVTDHYTLTTSLAGKTGTDFLYVSRDQALRADIAPRFATVEALAPIQAPVGPGRTMDFSVWLLRGFKGY